MVVCLSTDVCLEDALDNKLSPNVLIGQMGKLVTYSTFASWPTIREMSMTGFCHL